VFLLPVTVSGDGTAIGLVQISLTYSLNVVVALISITTLWLSCSLLSREVENYNIHMVVSKPCPRWILWMGKWFGVFLMHSIILIVSATIIYGLILWRVHKGQFSETELKRLNQEILVGRREYKPEILNIHDEVEAAYLKKRFELAEGHDVAKVKRSLGEAIAKRKSEIKPGETRDWNFRGVALGKDTDMISLRYRIYSGSATDTNQYLIPCQWGFRLPEEAKKVADPFGMVPLSVLGGTFQEMPVLAKQVVDTENQGAVVVRFKNMPAEYWKMKEAPSVVIQSADDPVLLAKISGFLSNYIRSMILAIFQIAFLAALGTTVGALFSTPVAAFVAISYLIIGLSVNMAISAPLKMNGVYQYKSVTQKCLHYFARGLGTVVVSVGDLDATSDLANGRLVEYSRLGQAFLTLLLLRSGLIAGFGIWILSRRQLGLVIKK